MEFLLCVQSRNVYLWNNRTCVRCFLFAVWQRDLTHLTKINTDHWNFVCTSWNPERKKKYYCNVQSLLGRKGDYTSKGVLTFYNSLSII